jgi:hypothetical protein
LLKGKWLYSNSIWYTSILIVEENGTFTFHDQGCYGQRFSRGLWTVKNRIIEFTSFDNFKQKVQTETEKSDKVIEKIKSNYKLGKEEEKYTTRNIKNVSVPILPKSTDSIRIYIYKLQLMLMNDTLYCVESNKLLEDARFHRIKNNR